MSERKVLNKYYPPDFDPSKIPRLRLPKDRQYTVRLMAPCNMRCKTCGEYIYKGKKFNARKETVQNEDYLGIKVFRFYIKCPRCLAEITFKTDPQNTDYIVEHGATRNFQALKLAEEQAAREAQEQEEEEKNNPMKLLENRTKASKQEMELYEALEELKDLNKRQANVDFESMLKQQALKQVEELKRQEEEDEAFIKEVFAKRSSETVKRIEEEDSDDESLVTVKKHKMCNSKPTSILVDDKCVGVTQENEKKSWEKSIGLGISSKKGALNSLVRAKSSTNAVAATSSSVGAKGKQEVKNTLQGTPLPSSSGLSLLGAYSDSDSS